MEIGLNIDDWQTNQQTMRVEERMVAARSAPRGRFGSRVPLAVTSCWDCDEP
jgi:hypothetical protein